MIPWMLAMSVTLAQAEPYPLWSGGEFPTQADIPVLRGVEFHAIKPWELERDGYRFLHGVALAWHKGRLYASFGHNQGGENTASEQARGRISEDAGRTWSEPFDIDRGEGDLAVSHGVFLLAAGTLWAFHGAYYGTMQRVHTRAYRLAEDGRTWDPLGVVVEGGFWPMQEPLRMQDGNWIMSGISVGNGNPAAVAISHGDDLTRWDLVAIPLSDGTGSVWGESAVLVEGVRVVNVARWGEQARPLVAVSEDCGRTWTPARAGNMPMTTSKPCAGRLSSGESYLICSTSADGGNRRAPLTIALSRPGESAFSRVLAIRDAVAPGANVESHPGAALAYPYAVEHEGRLYVGYSNSGGRGGKDRSQWNNNSAELAVIPISALRE